MERAGVDGIELEYEVSGSGEPVVLIHGALIADSFRSLLAEPSLAGRYRLIHYHRRGYSGSTHAPDPVSLSRQATDCRALLGHLGVQRAHIVGHSYGGSIGLQLALDFPDIVHSLALLEPAVFGYSTGQAYRDALARGEQRYRETSAAVDQVLPEAFEQAVADAGTWFEIEAPALRSWNFGEAELRRISQPVLAVPGGESDALWPRFRETLRLLMKWLPRADGFVLPDAKHFMQADNPRGLAEALSAFHARHPLPTRPLDSPDRK